MSDDVEQFLQARHASIERRALPEASSAACDQLQAILRDLWLAVGLTDTRDQARGALVVVGLMVERAKALGVDVGAVESCAHEIRLAVSDLINP